MADPLSIVGTAAGLVSLGLQVYGGIKNYLDAIRGRQDDLASIHRHATVLKNALEAIEAGIQSRSVIDQTSAPAAISCLHSCRAKLNALNLVLTEITPTSSAPGSNTFRLKFEDNKMKLAYPFKRLNLTKLEERLQNANLILHTALHTLGINLLATLNDTVSDYRIQSDTLAAGIISLRSESASINASIHAVSGSSPAVLDGVQALSPLIETESTKISSQIHHDGQILRQNISYLEKQIDDSFLSQKSQLERIESHLVYRFQEDKRLRRLEEILAGLELTDLPRRQHDSATWYLGRLVAKPDNLKFMCDEFTSQESAREPYSSRTIQAENFALQSRKKIQSSCSCGAIRGHKRHYSRWGHLLIYQDEDGGATHLRDCKYAGFNIPESFRKIGATYFGSGNLLRCAIGITFSMRRGAGGASMGANLVYYNVVNTQTAPAFQLMSVLEIALQFRGSIIPECDTSRLFGECSSRIRHLYQTGKAGPKDLTPQGQSILHSASFLIQRMKNRATSADFRCLRYFIVDLLNYGIPAGVSDDYGRTPLVGGLAFLEDDSRQTECAEIYDLLFSKGADLPISDFRQARQLVSLRYGGKFAKLLGISLPAAEVLGCNPLSIAVLQRNFLETKRLVDVDPSLCFERNVFSQTPIHFAIHWPNGLKQLLRASSLPPEIPVELETPLSASTSYSSYFCKEGDHPVHCSNCSCYESAEIILSYDCSIVDLHACIISASHRTKLKLFEHLKDRRVRLREFCLKKLPEESSKLGLHSNQIPDSKANDVVELLQQKGIEIPRPLRIRIERDSATSTNTYYWRSVYHTIDCPATADMLLQLGFTDLDSNDTQGNTPLSTATSPEYALWLIDHGADITAPSATTVGSKLNQMIAHGVGYEFGLYFFHLYLRMNKGMRKIDIESRNRLLRLICNSDRPDNCRCACSTQGCIPFIFLLKGALNIWSDCSHSAIYLRGIWTGLTELYNVFPQEILEKPGIYLTTLRYITFLALGIRHTCCYSYCMLRMRNFEEFDEEDFEEFREEDSPLVELLEELMEEFETEGEFPDADFIDFLEGYWKDRMEGVLMEMEESKMTNEQKRKLEEIGVKLSKDVEEVPRVMEEEMEEEKDLSYWIRRMDEIVSI